MDPEIGTGQALEGFRCLPGHRHDAALHAQSPPSSATTDPTTPDCPSYAVTCAPPNSKNTSAA
ncbi:MAG: hypothetical protein LC799_11790 [Actinobacteria bacterium]|nr:hypothetical protein [Actinomycetota bacterium]